MPFKGTPFDREFARQALAEKRLTRAQVNELIGAQIGLVDRGIQRAMPVIAHELDFLSRQLLEQLIRHVLLRIGSFDIGGYRVIRQIGRGGMGVVYLAEQLSLKRSVALKLLIRRDMSRKFVDRFKREGRACARVRHHNLVAAFDVGAADGWHYFAMEYVDGPTVGRGVRANGPFSELEGIRVIRQIAEALACAHNLGIIHRDIKPGNIMVGKDSVPKLCDLGLARIRNVDESEIYEPGTTLGSRRYMSPEQARGLSGIDGRSDIYSLGLTLFYMLTGVPPFSDVPKERVMIEHLRGMLEWPSDVNSNVSEEVSRMIWRMAARDPAKRPQTAEQLVEELRVIEDQLAASAEFGPDEHRQPLGDEEPAPAESSDDDVLPVILLDEEDQTSEEKVPISPAV